MIGIIFFIIIFLFSAIIHEVSHGWVAYYLGDDTAKRAGRLTLNPLKHLDPFGSILFPLMLILMNSRIIFGWAKPVPINPFNFRDRKYGSAKVAVAGPLSNIVIAIIFGLMLRFIPFYKLSFGPGLSLAFAYIVWVNLLLAFFNLMPIPPLDGSHLLFALLPKQFEKIKMFLTQYGMFILIFFILFFFRFLIPIVNVFFKLITSVPFYY